MASQHLGANNMLDQHDPDPDDFDFDETNRYHDQQSLGGRTSSPPPQMRNTDMGLNPHIGGLSGADASQRINKEREEINLRGRVLQEQLMNKNATSATQGDLAMSNQMRIGGNYMKVDDPLKPPYSPFYLMCTGHIQSGTFDD